MSIEVKHLQKNFGSFSAVNDISLSFPNGELVALLGPSGCGKTTLLRMIAGLEIPDAGEIWLNGTHTTDLSVRDRRVGFVFQHYALFKHMTVFDNVAFGLRMKPASDRPSKEKIKSKVMDLLKLVQLDWLADRFPSQLSGGQRQRIALARALAIEPKVLLLDEPFGALDAKVRKELRRWLRRLHDELHITSIFVTHDQEEALEVADRIVVLNKGKVEQTGTPSDIYNNPASPFVFDFLGSANQFERPDGRVFARPHDTRITTQVQAGLGVQARVARQLRFGLNTRIELIQETESAHRVYEVEMDNAEADQLDLIPGQLVTVYPDNYKHFLDNTPA